MDHGMSLQFVSPTYSIFTVLIARFVFMCKAHKHYFDSVRYRTDRLRFTLQTLRVLSTYVAALSAQFFHPRCKSAGQRRSLK